MGTHRETSGAILIDSSGRFLFQQRDDNPEILYPGRTTQSKNVSLPSRWPSHPNALRTSSVIVVGDENFDVESATARIDTSRLTSW